MYIYILRNFFFFGNMYRYIEKFTVIFPFGICIYMLNYIYIELINRDWRNTENTQSHIQTHTHIHIHTHTHTHKQTNTHKQTHTHTHTHTIQERHIYTKTISRSFSLSVSLALSPPPPFSLTLSLSLLLLPSICSTHLFIVDVYICVVCIFDILACVFGGRRGGKSKALSTN